MLVSIDNILYPDLRESHRPAFKDQCAADRVLSTMMALLAFSYLISRKQLCFMNRRQKGHGAQNEHKSV